MGWVIGWYPVRVRIAFHWWEWVENWVEVVVFACAWVHGQTPNKKISSFLRGVDRGDLKLGPGGRVVR